MFSAKTFLRFEKLRPGLYRTYDDRTLLVLLADGKWAVIRDCQCVAVRPTKKQASIYARNHFSG